MALERLALAKYHLHKMVCAQPKVWHVDGWTEKL